MSEKQIRVLIVDDHSGVRRGIKNLLQAAKDMIVVGEGGNGAEAIELATTRKPDILLLDIELPDQQRGCGHASHSQCAARYESAGCQLIQ